VFKLPVVFGRVGAVLVVEAAPVLDAGADVAVEPILGMSIMHDGKGFSIK
jgi:hypothetical protein